jgi:hypothetical protein
LWILNQDNLFNILILKYKGKREKEKKRKREKEKKRKREKEKKRKREKRKE